MTGEYLTNFSTGQLVVLRDTFATSMGNNFFVVRSNMASLYSLLVSDGAIRIYVVLGVVMVIAVVSLNYAFK